MNLHGFKKSELLISLLCALFFAIAFQRIAYVDYERIRIPITEGHIQIPNSDPVNIPFQIPAGSRKNLRWLVLEVQSNSPESSQLDLHLNRNLIGSFQIGPNQSTRIITVLQNNAELQRRNIL